MYIKLLKIRDFKSIKNLEIHLDKQFSILTGINNSGKTTILEALSLWVECFEKLLNIAQRSVTGKYLKGDYILGPTNNKYFNFDEINSVRCPDFEDIFRNRDVKRSVMIEAIVVNEEKGKEQNIGFSISNSTNTRYVISLIGEKTFDYRLFNVLFSQLANGGVSSYFASPVASIEQREDFVTDPILTDAIRQRHSYQYIRNRIYKLYHSSVFKRFQEDLSFVLYGTASAVHIVLRSQSDINKDKRVVITYSIGRETVEKDLALLGSGTLQVIEILLDLYHQSDERRDLNLVLLDEPDSHIHRDIQERLIQTLNRSGASNQVVITTHNESLIRTASPANLFHVDGTGLGVVRCLYKKELPKLNSPHFSGPYPALDTPVIRSINSTSNGLDFISAIEADKIVFVEGDDDARLLYRLFNNNIANKNTKLMFWVMGGVSKVLDKVDMYQAFFSDIKNAQTLWEKSILVFDRDRLTDNHLKALQDGLQDKKSLPNYAHKEYTQESVYLTDLHLLAVLLSVSIEAVGLKPLADVETALQTAMTAQEVVIKSRFDSARLDEQFVKQYKGMYLEKLDKVFGCKVATSDIKLEHELQAYYEAQPAVRLSNKEDLVTVVNQALATLGISETVDESIAYTLAQHSSLGTMYPQWEEMVKFMEG
ncbi:MAG: SMC domain-containing protein [bacterium P3]|nr:MAG: SMC domain-containing protein [bacterium P3]KWW42497.1 MAG: SMC domain-containing protein [bacterium F083]